MAFFVVFLLLIIVFLARSERLPCVYLENPSRINHRCKDTAFYSFPVETMSQDSLIDDEQNDQKLILSPSPSSGTIRTLKLHSPGKSLSLSLLHFRPSFIP